MEVTTSRKWVGFVTFLISSFIISCGLMIFVFPYGFVCLGLFYIFIVWYSLKIGWKKKKVYQSDKITEVILVAVISILLIIISYSIYFNGFTKPIGYFEKIAYVVINIVFSAIIVQCIFWSSDISISEFRDNLIWDTSTISIENETGLYSQSNLSTLEYKVLNNIFNKVSLSEIKDAEAILIEELEMNKSNRNEFPNRLVLFKNAEGVFTFDEQERESPYSDFSCHRCKAIPDTIYTMNEFCIATETSKKDSPQMCNDCINEYQTLLAESNIVDESLIVSNMI